MEIWIFLIGFIRLFDLERSMKTHCCFCNVIKRFLGQSRDDFLPLYFPFRQSRLQRYLGISYLVLRRKDSMYSRIFFAVFERNIARKVQILPSECDVKLQIFFFFLVSILYNTYVFFFTNSYMFIYCTLLFIWYSPE